MKAVGKLFRNLADWLEPQPLTIELIELNRDENYIQIHGRRPPIQGFPVYFVRHTRAVFEFWPVPGRDIKILVRP